MPAFKVSVYQQWTEWLPWNWKHYNWLNFTPFRLDIETGSYTGRYLQVDFCLLNFGITFDWWDRASRDAFVAEWEGKIANWKEREGLT